MSPGLDAAAAGRWSAAAVPGWVPRGLLVAGWVAALVVAVATDDSRCVAENPSVCGPDRHFAVALGLMFATPLLLVAMPALGCVAGVLFGLDEALTDPLRTAAIAFGLHGAACLTVLGWLLVSRSRQARIARDVGTPGTAPPGPPPPQPFWSGRRALAAVLAVVSLTAALLYRHDQGDVDRHLAAAGREPARVAAVDHDEWTVTLVLPAGEDRVTVDVIDTGPYEVGAEVPVLVDRTGRTPWVALVAELPDPTFPLTGAVLTGLLAAVALGWDAARRRALRRLGSRPSVAVAVLVEPSGDEAVLHPVGGGPAFARVRLAAPLGTGPGDWDDEGWELDEDAWRMRFGLHPAGEDPAEEDQWTAEEIAEFGRDWRSANSGTGTGPERAGTGERRAVATVLGDLRGGGWVVLSTAAGTWWPAGPVRPPRRSAPWHALTGDEPPPDFADLEPWPGVPVPAAPVVPDLPLVARPPDRSRLTGAVLLVGAVAALLGSVLLIDSWYGKVIALVVGAQATGAGAGRLLVGVRLERTGLVVFGRWRTVRVPWSAVHGARRVGDLLAVAWVPDEAMDVGPFRPDPGEGSEDAAERVGGAVGALRERALAAGDPGGEPTSAWSPAAAATALYVVGAVAAGWLALS